MTRNRASTKAAGARFEAPCPSCGDVRWLLHKPTGGMCRKCAALLASRAAATKTLGVPFVDRLAKAVNFTAGGCWLWVGHRYGNGYGCIAWQGKQHLAHRVTYEQLVGPIPAGLQLDHLCRVRACVNPDHLEPVTAAENTRRAMRTHCTNGHEFTAENTYRPSDGKRYCRDCRRQRNRNRRAAV